MYRFNASTIHNDGRRCGACCGARGDVTSPMCMGSDPVGELHGLSLHEVQARCTEDVRCIGFYQRQLRGHELFRPVQAWTQGRRFRLRPEDAVFGKCLPAPDCQTGSEAAASELSISGPREQVATVKTNVSRHVDLGRVTGNKYGFPFFNVTLTKLANSLQRFSSAGAKFDEAIRGQRQTQIVSISLGESNTEARQCKLLRKESHAPCELGRSFGCDFASGSMWVNGCRGWFRCASSDVHCGYPGQWGAHNCSCARAPKAVDFRVSLESTQAPRTHDLFNLQFPPVCHGRFMAVTDDLWGAGLGFTSTMLSRLMVVAVQKRRILIEVPAKKPRWCNQTLQCFYQPWTNCSLDQKGADVLNVSLNRYHRSRLWYGTNKLTTSMQPHPAQFFFRPNALVQRHVNAVIAQCGGTDYWTVHVRDSPEKRAERPNNHFPDLQGYVSRLPQNVKRILWQTANPAAFQAILRYSSQRPGLRFCYTNFSRHTEDVWGGRNASFTYESGLTGAVNGELGHLGTGLISLQSSMWTNFLASLNASMKVIAV